MATTEQMTANKMLAELKTMEARIANTIDNGVYCVANKHSNTKIAGMSIDEYKSKMQGDLLLAICILQSC